MQSNQRDPITPNSGFAVASIPNAVFMSRVYLWMVIGIFVTGLISYAIGISPEFTDFVRSNPQRFQVIIIGLIITQFAAVIGLSLLIRKISSLFATIIYLFYAALVGLTFSILFLAYTTESIAATFFITAFSFAGLSAFGYITKIDLGPVGSFCTIGLFGLIGVMLLSFFVPALMGSAVQFAISVIGVAVFSGLTAFDTQKIKNLNLTNMSDDDVKKGAIFGALTLYLDFINMFLFLLRLFGRRR